MRGKLRAFVVLAVVLLTTSVGVKPARAEWLVMQVTPKSVSDCDRLIRVKIVDAKGKDGENEKECEITIAPRSQKKGNAIEDSSHGSLYLNPENTPPTKFPKERGIAVPMSEKRSSGGVTYTFRVSPERLSRLRFEFWDSPSQKSLGGDIYWFNLRDFISTNTQRRQTP